MKKLFSLAIILLLVGCAGQQIKQPPEPEYYQMSPAVIEKLMSLLQETGANKIRAFTGRTGGTSGKLDSIAVASLANNDLGLVFDVSDSIMYFYKFNSTGTDAESDPYYIRPDDYSSAGVWYLMNGFSFNRSATPQWNFRDSDATDTDDNARIFVNATNTGSGTENVDFTIAIQIGGNLTNIISIDADGKVTVGTLALDPSGGLTSQTPTVSDPDTWTMSGSKMYGGIWSATAIGTGSLPAVAAGMNFSVTNHAASVTTIDPNAADTIILNGTSAAQDENIVSDGTISASLVCWYAAANTWECIGYGYAEASP